MSAHCFFTEKKDWEMGELVCIDSSTGYVEEYDPLDIKPVVGCSFVSESGYGPNGRNWFAINGPVYYENDFYEWKEDLTSDFTTENSLYAPFNPLNTEGYLTVITSGIAALKSDIISGIPSSWILIKANSSFNWYLVK